MLVLLCIAPLTGILGSRYAVLAALKVSSLVQRDKPLATIDFGLMLRQNDPGHSLQELLVYDRQCIEALKAGFSTLWLEDHLQVDPMRWSA